MTGSRFLMLSICSSIVRSLAVVMVAGAATVLANVPAAGEALLLVEVDSGKVLHAENATVPWYPASVTKIMTAYVMLRAVKEGRVTLDKPVPVSPAAGAQAPTKMGFPVGTLVTLDKPTGRVALSRPSARTAQAYSPPRCRHGLRG